MGSSTGEAGPKPEPVESFQEATETTEMLRCNSNSNRLSRAGQSSSSMAARRRLQCRVVCITLLLGIVGACLGGQLHNLITARFAAVGSWASTTRCTKSWCSLVSDHHITNLHSGRCLDWSKFEVESKTCDRSSKSQLWVYNKTEHIQTEDGYCLGSIGKDIHIWPCEDGGTIASKQHWKYDLITSQIAQRHASPELCLQESTTNSSVTLQLCNHTSGQQRWRVQTSTVSHVHLVEAGQIQLGMGSCLDASVRTHVAICNASSRSQLWSYGSSTQQIRGFQGGCLDASDVDNLSPCNDNDFNQKWHADLDTGQLRSNSGGCLRSEEATDRRVAMPAYVIPYLVSCDALDSGQRWKLSGLMASKPHHEQLPFGGLQVEGVQVAYTVIGFVGTGSCLAILLLLTLRRGEGSSPKSELQKHNEDYDLKARAVRVVSSDSSLPEELAKQETSSTTTATSTTVEAGSLMGARPTSLMAGAQLSMWETASTSASSSSTLRERAQRQAEGPKSPLLPGVPERYVLTEDATYNGEWRARRPHGRGTQNFPDGGRFQGDMSSGNAYGWGSFEYADGSMYTGTWFNDLAQGQGTLTCPDKWVYKGLFDRGKPHGHGTLTLQDGSTFTGQYREGAKDGVGVFVFRGEEASGSYEGQYVKDVCHGKGIFKWDDGCKYEGQWRLGKKHGRGQLTFPDGCCYDGAFEADQKNGPGTMEWADGCRYTGEWNGGKQHGRGAYFDGRITTEGLWETGRRKSAASLAQA